MKIGVDIDGVLNYRQEFMLECGTHYCLESGKGSLINPTGAHLSTMFGWDRATVHDFWNKYGILQMYEWPAQRFAAEVIRQLQQDGHEIWIITGRNRRDALIEGMPDNDWEEVTKLWLHKNRIPYDNIAFDLGRPAPYDKGTFCTQHNIPIMIEDSPDYLLDLAGKTHIFIFDCLYNHQVHLDNSTRVYSWYDIYQKIKTMETLQ